MWTHREDDRIRPGQRMFQDRADAGAKLATALSAYRKSHPLILGIPRGGVPVAYQIAKRLDADLDVIVARKIVAPDHPELAIGAVAADGSSYTNARLRALSTLSGVAVARLTEAAREAAHASEQHFRLGLAPIEPAGRVVIVVDDGLATGATMIAALRALRRAGVENLVVAVPVGSSQACASIARDVDALICLFQPEPFHAVGAHYEHFEPCLEDEVQRLLIKQRNRAEQASR